MIDHFRKLNPINLLLLAIVAVLLRVGVLVQVPESIEFTFLEPYVASFFNFNPQTLFSPAANIFFATVITLIQAIIFNRIINNYNLLGKPSFLPALMYVTGSSLLVPFLVLSPALLCNFLMIWIIERFLSIYRRTEARSPIYDVGMLVAIGTLIYFPFAGVFPLIWIALTIFRPFDWREWIAAIVGFFTIYFFLGVAYYLRGAIEDFYAIDVPLATTFPKQFHIDLYDYIVLIPLLLIMILSVSSLQKKLYRSNVHIRKSYLTLFFVLVFAFLSYYIKQEYRMYHFILAVPAAAVFMGHYFMNASRKWFYESLYILLLICIIGFQLL